MEYVFISFIYFGVFLKLRGKVYMDYFMLFAFFYTCAWFKLGVHTSTYILQYFVGAFLMASPFNIKMKYSLNKHIASFIHLKALDNE